MFHKDLPEGQAGDQIGALLRGVRKDMIRRGMVVCHPKSISAHTKIQAQVENINHAYDYYNPPPTIGLIMVKNNYNF